MAAIFTFSKSSTESLAYRGRPCMLLWDGTGVWLCQRRLHQGKFVWPKLTERCFVLMQAEWEWLIAGVNWQRLSALFPAHLKSKKPKVPITSPPV